MACLFLKVELRVELENQSVFLSLSDSLMKKPPHIMQFDEYCYRIRRIRRSLRRDKLIYEFLMQEDFQTQKTVLNRKTKRYFHL